MIYSLQKASVWKRASAFIFDAIIFLVVAVGVGFGVSALVNYDEHQSIIQTRTQEYIRICESEYKAEYGEEVKLDLSKGYDEMSEAEQKLYHMLDEYLRKDESLAQARLIQLSLSLLIVTVGLLVANIILEFIVPLLFKNGQTLGKKIFGLGVMRTNSTKASTMVLFVRMLLGKHTIETMVPICLAILIWFGVLNIVGLIVLVGILLLQIIVIIATHTNSAIHDLLADTVVIDLSTQLIFEDEQALLDYKKKLHEEEAAKQTY